MKKVLLLTVALLYGMLLQAQGIYQLWGTTADRKLNEKDHQKINKFSYFESVQREEIKILTDDLLLANKFFNDFHDLVYKADFIYNPEGTRAIHADCTPIT